VRNNAAEPALGHVIMFGAASAGWLVLFLINLSLFAPGPGWWARAVFSGLLLVASLLFTAVLWRRLSRGRGGSPRS
jgi:membrane protein implicated in regulation of membrane protease activity